MSIETKFSTYSKTRPFSGFLTESVNGFVLFEGVISNILNSLINDTQLFKQAVHTYKAFDDDSKFDTQWVDILETLIKKFSFNVDNQTLHRLFKVIPMEFYNYAKNQGIL